MVISHIHSGLRAMRSAWKMSLMALFWFLMITRIQMGQTEDFDDGSIEDDNGADESFVDLVDEPSEIQYSSPVPINDGNVYFWENFDEISSAKKRWLTSKAQKEGHEGTSKYDGEWGFQIPQKVIFNGDSALVLKSKAKHAAIAAKLDKVFEFRTKPLFVQYEVAFQNGMDCGGSYIKLLSQSPALDLNKFTDKSPYTIMFGPDKCGNEYKLHFIFRHKNPINGTFEEKHAKQPTVKFDQNYADKKPHLYLLKLFPDSSFEIYVDGSLVNSGSLLSDMEPSVNPPQEIPDLEDKKPSDWDERESIPDVSMTKPDDWDDNAPPKIDDPDAIMPAGWLQNEEPFIADETAVKPDDWDESMDDVWEPPKKNNPLCDGAPGCGIWSPPKIDNPEYKGRWRQPMMSNPNYKGKWTPRNIPNPHYFDDKEPFKMTPIGAVGIEIWTMTDQVLFDNFLITDSEKVLEDWTSKSYDIKKRAIDKDSKSWYGKFMRKINYHIGVWTGYFVYCSIPIFSYIFYLWKMYNEEEGVFSRLLSYTNAHPWLWAVYTVVIGLPLVLILTFCCGTSQDKRDESNKKTDDYVEDTEEGESDFLGNSPNRPTSRSSASSSGYHTARQSMNKENLEGDVEEEEEMDDVEGSEVDENEQMLRDATTEESSNESEQENEVALEQEECRQQEPDSSSEATEVKKRKPRRE